MTTKNERKKASPYGKAESPKKRKKVRNPKGANRSG